MADDRARPLRVLIVDDHPFMRAGIRAAIESEGDMAVAGEASNEREAAAVYAATHPEVVLMDLRMPETGGLEAIAAIRAQDPEARILVLTTFDSDDEIYRAVQAGARGYLLKGTPPDDVLAAIRKIHAGERLIAPGVAARLAELAGTSPLSARETEVLSLAAKGLNNGEIAGVLSLGFGTVKNHLKSAFAKLGATDRTEAVLIAIQRGIIRMP
jgi:DNA-binding NarL/FixJ family response regulator